MASSQGRSRWHVSDSDGSDAVADERSGPAAASSAPQPEAWNDPGAVVVASEAGPAKRRVGRPRGSQNISTILKRRAEVSIDELSIVSSAGRPDGDACNNSGGAHDAGVGSGQEEAPLGDIGKVFQVVSPLQRERLLLNTKAVASAAGVDRRRVPDLLAVLAQTLRRDETDALQSIAAHLQHAISAGMVRPVAFQIRRKYDETPLRLRIRWDKHAEALDLEPGAKLILVELAWTCVLEPCGNEAVPGQRRNLTLRGRCPIRMKVADSMTASVMHSVLVDARRCIPDALTSLFPAIDTVSNSDEHASNVAAEHLYIDSMAGTSESVLHVLCDVHKTSTVAEKATMLDSATVTGCLQVALACRGSGATCLLRRSLCKFLDAHLVRISGHAGTDAKQHRESMMDCFLSSSKPKARGFRTSLGELLNGDWTQPTPQHFCAGCCTSREDTLRKCYKHVARVFFGKGLKLFPRSNWMGADATFDGIGLLIVCHNLLYSAFALSFRFAPLPGLAQRDEPIAADVPLPGAEFDAEDAANGDGMPPAADDGPEPTGNIEHALVLAQGGPMDLAAFGADSAMAQHQRETASTRKAAAAFLLHADTPQNLYVARRQLRPQVRLMTSMLRTSAPRWERKEWLNLERTGSRDYRILLAYDCKETGPFLQHVCELIGEDWPSPPTPTLRSCCLAFRMLARQGAVAFKLLIQRHRGFPYKVFDIARDCSPQILEELLEEPRCLRDPWSDRFLEEHNSAEALASPSAQMRLRAILEIAHVDTVSTEREHAGNLRKAKNQHGSWAPSLEALAAYRTLQSAVPELHERSKRQQQRGRSLEQARRGIGESDRRRSRAVGPWRAFLSEQTSKPTARGATHWTRAEITGLKEAYHALSDAEKQKYIERGQAMTLANRIGVKRQRTREERRERSAATDGLARLAALAAAPEDSSAIECLGPGDDLDGRCRRDRIEALAVCRQDLGLGTLLRASA